MVKVAIYTANQMGYAVKQSGAAGSCEASYALTNGDDAPRLHGLYHAFSHGAIPNVGDRAFLFPTDDAVSEKLLPLIQQSLAGAERTTGRTRRLWLALYHLLLQWWHE